MEIIPLKFDDITPENINGSAVRKHNDLIEANYLLPNLQEQRIILMLLSQIKPSDEDFKCYRITVSDFAEMLGLKGNDLYAELDRATKALVSRTISIRKDDKSFLHMNWLSSAEYRSGAGYVELAFDPKLKPYLLQLKTHYTQYQISNAIHFKSTYSIRLYELLKKESFKENNGGFKVFFEYAKLRDYFGIGKKEYLKFNDFKRKTIEPASREISEKTDLDILDVQYGKTGRKVTSIIFSVSICPESETEAKQKKSSEDQEPAKEEGGSHPIIESLVSLGFSEENAKSFKIKHGIKKIERNIAYTLAKKQSGEVKNIPAYLNQAIEQDWGSAWESERVKEKDKKEKIRLDEAQKKKEEAELILEKKKASNEQITSFLLLPKIKRNAIIKACIDGIKTISSKTRCLDAYKEFGEDELKKDRSILRLHLLAYLKELETVGNE